LHETVEISLHTETVAGLVFAERADRPLPFRWSARTPAIPLDDAIGHTRHREKPGVLSDVV
jgi:hypothetical protein